MRLNKDMKVDRLGRVPLFAQCSKKELGKIASVADEVELDEGFALTKEGDHGREFVVIMDGTASVTRQGAVVGEVRAGDFIGEMSLVTGRPRNATVTATSPLRALVVTDRTFHQLLQETPGMSLKILAALAARVPDTDDGLR